MTNFRSRGRQKDVPTTTLPEDRINRRREVIAAFLCKEVFNVVGKFRPEGPLLQKRPLEAGKKRHQRRLGEPPVKDGL